MSSVRSDVESAIAAAKSFPSVSFVPQIPQMFTDDARFIAFKRSDHFAFDAISIALLVVAQMSMFGTRLALYRAFSLTTYFTIVVVLSDLCCVIFWSYIIITMCGRFGLAASICKKINNSTLYREVLDLVTILSVVTAGVYLFARVEGGQCPSETNIWLSQQCNPVGRAGSIPEDTVLLNYLMPVIAQVVFKGVRFRTIVIAWAVATACVTGAICSIQGWVQIYTILYSVFFLYISYEIERFMRVAYVQTLQTLVQTEGERDLESLRRDQEFTAERARLELHIITIQGVHDMQQAEQEKRAMELERDHLRSLIGNVAHDLKTPIQAISMGVEILKAECISAFAPCSSSSRTISHSNSGANSDDDIPSCKHGCSSLDAMSELPFDDLFRSMFATCRFMTMAINRSIDFTKASSNIQLVPSLETVNFHETLCGPVDCIRNLQAGVAIVVAPLPADMCPYVITDKHWLGENLLCALSNAVKYSMGGLVYINTVLSRSAFNLSLEDDLVPLTGDEIHYIRVTIIDSGIGISAEKRKNLFQPFRQAQRMAGGTGLGLYSLLKRMESLGGSCGIDARQDGEMGSEFWFTFPYRPDVAAGAPSGMDDSTRGSNFLRQPGGLNVIVSDAPWARRRNFWMERSQNEMNQQPLRILIIEDSLSIVKITTRLLTTKGHVVESAINGSIGLNRLMEVYDTEDDFDMVLSDLQMPVMDGFECVRRYRAFEEERKSLLLSRSLDFIRKTSSTSSWDYQGTASETETEAVPNKDVLKLLARRSLSRRFLGFRDNMAIVGMSANSDSQSATEAIEAGMNIFITKPFTGADLQNILILFDSD